MSNKILTDCPIFFGQYNLTSDVNSAMLSGSKEGKESTNMGSLGWKQFLPGIGDSKASLQTMLNMGATNTEPALSQLPGTSAPLSFIESSNGVNAAQGVAGDPAVFMTAECLSFDMGGKVGDIASWNGEFGGSGVFLRGQLLQATTLATSSTTGTAVQIGAVASNQAIVAVLHVFTATGTTPTFSCKIQSDSASNFPSPTDVLTFTTATTATSEQKSVSGANTDTWWRCNWTVGGTTPNFYFAVVAGIITLP